jgi:hypothetical protein
VTGWQPVPKVTAAALGGAVATLLVWAFDASRGVSVPPEAAAALTALLAFAAGYLKAPAEQAADDTGHADLPGLVVITAIAVIVVTIYHLLVM